MLRTDREAVICDLAETYHIYDYKSLPCQRVATFCVGLRNNSRIKMRMSGSKYTLDTLLLASALDKLALLVWSKTKDSEHGLNRPRSVVETLLGKNENRDIKAFNTAEEFEKKRKEIIGKGGKQKAWN